MNDPLTVRVRSAAVAGWWTVLIAVCFIILLWLAYLRLTTIHPAWVLRLWGPDMTWPLLQDIFLRVIVTFRILVWCMILAVLWLTLWAHQLKKRTMATA